MIEYISGKLVSKTPSEIIVDLNGMGYIINCSVNCYDKLPKLDSKICLFFRFSSRCLSNSSSVAIG